MATERLLVVEPFGDHAFGARIEGETAIKKALKTHPQHVVREMVEDGAPEPAADETPAPQRAKAPPPDDVPQPMRTKHALKG